MVQRDWCSAQKWMSIDLVETMGPDPVPFVRLFDGLRLPPAAPDRSPCGDRTGGSQPSLSAAAVVSSRMEPCGSAALRVLRRCGLDCHDAPDRGGAAARGAAVDRRGDHPRDRELRDRALRLGAEFE